VSRRNYYQQMADLTNGKNGETIAVLPEKAKFSIDPRDDGRSDWWFAPDFNDRKWSTVLTTVPFLGQGPYLDKVGYPYMGAMWYRLKVDVPASAKGKKIKLYCAAAETEGWVWVNGRFVGHRPYIEAYIRPNPIDMDVTDALVPGKTNVIAIRLHTNYVPSAMAAGMVSRLFLYSPKEDAAK
jgi:beta-galactosidase/beta-glucuronidase